LAKGEEAERWHEEAEDVHLYGFSLLMTTELDVGGGMLENSVVMVARYWEGSKALRPGYISHMGWTWQARRKDEIRSTISMDSNSISHACSAPCSIPSTRPGAIW